MDISSTFFEELGKGRRLDALSTSLLEKLKTSYSRNGISGVKELLAEIHRIHLGDVDANT